MKTRMINLLRSIKVAFAKIRVFIVWLFCYQLFLTFFWFSSTNLIISLILGFILITNILISI
jgi:hypothetical protein